MGSARRRAYVSKHDKPETRDKRNCGQRTDCLVYEPVAEP